MCASTEMTGSLRAEETGPECLCFPWSAASPVAVSTKTQSSSRLPSRTGPTTRGGRTWIRRREETLPWRWFVRGTLREIGSEPAAFWRRGLALSQSDSSEPVELLRPGAFRSTAAASAQRRWSEKLHSEPSVVTPAVAASPWEISVRGQVAKHGAGSAGSRKAG